MYKGRSSCLLGVQQRLSGHWTEKNMTGAELCVGLELVPLSAEKTFKADPLAWGALFKISEEHPRPFYIRVSGGGVGCRWRATFKKSQKYNAKGRLSTKSFLISDINRSIGHIRREWRKFEINSHVA